MASHSATSPRASASPIRSRVDALADQQARAGRRRKGNRGLQFRIIASAGAFIGIGPAAVEHVFALRVGFQIAGHNAGDRAVEPGQADGAVPSRSARRPIRMLPRLRKMRAKQMGYSRMLEPVQDLVVAPGEASVSRPLRLWISGGGLAQASQSSAGIWLTDDTASRVISDDAIDCQNRSRVTISHRTW